MGKMILNEAVTMDDLTAEDEFITAAEFEDATRTVVRTLGKNHDLDIIFAGNGAKTDGNTVILPAQDPTKLMTKKQYAVGQGYANHETMHNLCTDMKFFTNELKRMKGEGKKLAVACANAIEDVRIEKAAARLYPGIPSQISSTADYAAKMFLEQYLDNDPEIMKDFKRIGPLAITWLGRKRLGYTAPYQDKALALLEPEMLEQLGKWCDMIDAIETGANAPGDFDQTTSHKGTRKAVQFAEMLAKEIDDIEEEEDEGDGQGQPGKQHGKGNGQGGGGQQEAGKGNGGGGGGGGGHGQGQIERGDVENDDPIDPDMQSAVAALLAEGDKGHKWKPVTTALDVWVTRDTKVIGNRHRSFELSHVNNLPMYHRLASEVGNKTAVMKRKFERALLTAAEADYVSGQRAGRLDVRRRGVHIMQGKENIFRRKMDGQSVDTAVTILVDASGSMSGSEIYLASQVCVALAECLERTPVDLEILAFRSDMPHGYVDDGLIKRFHQVVNDVQVAAGNNDPRSKLFHRISPCMMFELKAFGDSLRESRVSLGAMPHLAGGGTTDGEAILKAATRLMQNKKPKKIMLVLTDGEAAYSVVNGSPMDFTKMAVNYCTKKLGINMVGVGIYTDYVKNVYKNWTAIENIEDMDKAVIDSIARLILGENFKVDNADVAGAAANYKRRAR